MKASEIEIGAVYRTTVGKTETNVRIDEELEDGGWVGANLKTDRTVRIKDARKLKERIEDANQEEDVSTTVDAVQEGNLEQGIKVPTKRVKKKLSKGERAALRAQSQADQENARLREEREDSSAGMTASEQAMVDSGGERPKKMGCLDAAAHVLKQANEPLASGQMMEQILEQGLWVTAGRTPAATLYSAILREIQRKGADARFVRADRGKFTLNQ